MVDSLRLFTLQFEWDVCNFPPGYYKLVKRKLLKYHLSFHPVGVDNAVIPNVVRNLDFLSMQGHQDFSLRSK